MPLFGGSSSSSSNQTYDQKNIVSGEKNLTIGAGANVDMVPERAFDLVENAMNNNLQAFSGFSNKVNDLVESGNKAQAFALNSIAESKKSEMGKYFGYAIAGVGLILAMHMMTRRA